MTKKKAISQIELLDLAKQHQEAIPALRILLLSIKENQLLAKENLGHLQILLDVAGLAVNLKDYSYRITNNYGPLTQAAAAASGYLLQVNRTLTDIACILQAHNIDCVY